MSGKIAEVELWPSQREAAKRSADLNDDLVVSLPTSAGKTRVAEIAALMTLSIGPAGADCDAAAGTIGADRTILPQDVRTSRIQGSPLSTAQAAYRPVTKTLLRTREIVIATPEKLDFALRSDPTLIDDVGLIVLDEGHMIGPSEREIRYETLVQRLLRRSDARRASNNLPLCDLARRRPTRRPHRLDSK